MPPDRTSAREPLGPDVIRIAIVVVAGAFMSILDTTVVNVALERLAGEFRAGFDDVQWIVTAYMLAMAAVIPLSGWISVRFGAKRIFIVSAVLFTLSSALCGLAWSLESLVGFRVIQGVGGGLLMPVGQMMLAQAAGPHRMGRVMSIVALPMLIAPVLGPMLGGLLVDHAGWEWIFFVNLPVGALAVTLAARLLKPDRPGAAWRFDPLGVALMAIGIPAITYGLAETGANGTIAVTKAWLPILVGVGLTTVYILYALRAQRPLLNVRLFGNGGFAAASVTAFALGGALFGGMILLPLYEQGPRLQSAFQTGLILAPQGLGAAIAATIAGRLTDRFGGGVVAIVGLTVLTLATIPFTQLSATTPQWQIMVALFFRGMGIGGSMMPAFAAAYASLKHAEVPDATSQLNVLQRVGGSVGTAVLAVVLARNLGELQVTDGTNTGAAIPLAVRERMADSYAHTHWWVMFLGLAAMIPAVVLFRVERRARGAAARAGHVAPAPAADPDRPSDAPSDHGAPSTPVP